MSYKRRSISLALIGMILSSLLPIGLTAQVPEPLYDIVIRNGRVLDGAGNPWILADVAIKDGRFARDRKGGWQRASVRSTRRGKYVSPGWIDMQDQSGNVLTTNGLAESKLLQGVTTAIAGETGTPVPAEKIGEYFAGLEKSGISLNFGTYYSATQARVAVVRSGSPRSDARRTFPDERPDGNRYERRCSRHVDGAHLSAGKLFEDRTTDRDGKGRGPLWRLLR